MSTNNKYMPFYSILIPSYNRPELIGETVNSILKNDFEDFELIISDDKSPRREEIVEVLQPFLRDARVQLHLQSENLREPGNRDFLFRAARGEWHIVLSDDDKLYPHALSTLATAINQYPGAAIYSFGYTIIDELGRPHYSRKAPKPLRVSIKNSWLARELLVSDTFPFWMYHPATFCARKDVQSMVKSSGDMGIGDDFMFMIDFINFGGVLQIVPEVLMCYRKMTPGKSHLQINQSAGELPQLISRARILQNLLCRTDLHPTFTSFVASPACRHRLLYDPVLWSTVPLKALLPQILLSHEQTCELTAYARKHPRALYRKWLTMRRATFFFSVFGFASLHEMLRVQFSRLIRHAT